MRIQNRLQTEITDYLYLEKRKIELNWPSIDAVDILNKGRLMGIDYAMTIISNWNKKDKGKVKIAELNQ